MVRAGLLAPSLCQRASCAIVERLAAVVAGDRKRTWQAAQAVLVDQHNEKLPPATRISLCRHGVSLIRKV